MRTTVTDIIQWTADVMLESDRSLSASHCLLFNYVATLMSALFASRQQLPVIFDIPRCVYVCFIH